MSFRATKLLHVYLEAGQRQRVGRLAWHERRSLFEYDHDFLASGLALSPFKLPLRPGVFTHEDSAFEGLFGLFNDSLPDGWGRLLLDRNVEKHGIQRRELTPLDRLAYVGKHGLGALVYEPDLSDAEKEKEPLALDRLAEEVRIVLEGENEEVFEELLRLSGSSSGARPKIVVQVNEKRDRVIHSQQALRRGHEHWLIKFGSSQDPRDIGAIEYAYSRMARAAGVEMPDTHLFRTKKGAYFGTKRFDRHGAQRVHMHSLSGLIHANHRHPTLDYDTILGATMALTRHIVQVEKAYALACFNVLAHNRDDHSKNFSFLLGEEWTMSPAYDLTFSYGPGGEQSTMVMGEGRHPALEHLRKLGERHGLKKAPRILEQVRAAVAAWRTHAKHAGVTAKSTNEVAKRIKT